MRWETASELDGGNAGFNLYRSLTADGERSLRAFIPAATPAARLALYRVRDGEVVAGQIYWYWVEDIGLSGAATLARSGERGGADGRPAVALMALDATAPRSAAGELLLAVLATWPVGASPPNEFGG